MKGVQTDLSAGAPESPHTSYLKNVGVKKKVYVMVNANMLCHPHKKNW